MLIIANPPIEGRAEEVMFLYLLLADYHGLPWITMDYHGLPWITMDYHGLPWITMDYHGLP